MATTTIEKELLHLERQYWNAMKEKDAEAAMRLTDDQFIVTGAQGVARLDRSQIGHMLQSANWTIHEFDVSDDVQVLQPADDVAVLAYKVSEKLTVDGKPVTLEAADASTWVKRDSRWVCALHTESILGDPFGRDRK
jgi:hypothetical protein